MRRTDREDDDDAETASTFSSASGSSASHMTSMYIVLFPLMVLYDNRKFVLVLTSIWGFSSTFRRLVSWIPKPAKVALGVALVAYLCHMADLDGAHQRALYWVEYVKKTPSCAK